MTMAMAALGTLALCGCTANEFLRAAGQSLYNAGRYVCTQSSNCDTPGGGAADRRN